MVRGLHPWWNHDKTTPISREISCSSTQIITDLIGSPDDTIFGFLQSDNAHARRNVKQLPQYQRQRFSVRFPNMSPGAVDLLERMHVFFIRTDALQLMRLWATNTWHLSMILMWNLFALDLLISNLRNRLSLNNTPIEIFQLPFHCNSPTRKNGNEEN